MSTPNNRRRDPGGFGGETLMLLVLIVVVVGGLVVTNVAVRLGAQLDGTAAELPSDPFGLASDSSSGAWRGRHPRRGSSRFSARSCSC